eukprot:354857-Chlamydomonas_euryale.AAC.21
MRTDALASNSHASAPLPQVGWQGRQRWAACQGGDGVHCRHRGIATCVPSDSRHLAVAAVVRAGRPAG